jgi:hypothetical protein
VVVALAWAEPVAALAWAEAVALAWAEPVVALAWAEAVALAWPARLALAAAVLRPRVPAADKRVL